MSFDLKRLHDVEIEILDFFVDYCEKNNLQYFLVYGTALGAYRHGGFIPWDDDLDVAMPREDYDKLLNSFNDDNASSKYSLENETTDPNWFLCFSKIRKKGTIFIESYTQNIYKSNGIYIDVFPLNYLSSPKKSFVKQRYYRHCLKFFSAKPLYKRRGSVRYLLEHIICAPAYILGKKRLLKAFNKSCIGKCDKADAKYLIEYDDDRIIQAGYDIYFPPRKISFEGKEYYCPNNIVEYLKNVYGETYMELPPERERTTHEPVKIEF